MESRILADRGWLCAYTATALFTLALRTSDLETGDAIQYVGALTYLAAMTCFLNAAVIRWSIEEPTQDS